ncbi:MAG TPA: dipeptide epimerase [Chloroflexota bacterium]|nr:dipeptide epimerase [Chloroflexota bacterium]
MPALELTHERMDLPFKGAWTISRGTRRAAENVLVRLRWRALDGREVEGLGEAAPYAFYGEIRGTVEACLDEFSGLLGDDPFAIDAIMQRVEARIRHNTAAKAAIDLARHELVGKLLGQPLWRLWGLDPILSPVTSFSIGLDEPEEMARKARDAAAFPILKIKLGTVRDLDIMEAIRDAVPGHRLVVDANAAWTPKQAVRRINDLRDFKIDFVEQPVAADDLDGLRYVRERSSFPIIADESCATEEDIPRLAGCVDGVNVKLMKCGGLRRARRLIAAARAHHLTVMGGCLIESSLAITAAAHLLPLLDYADLDGHLHLAQDPFDGVSCEGGKLTLPERPGIGAVAR